MDENAPSDLDESKESVRYRAIKLWQIGLQEQLEGNLDEAMDCYDRSLDILPTAEAYVFKGWGYSFRLDLLRAIECCKRAIEVDPTLGNAYNDIGAYLVELGREDEAIEWFERAKDAPRYDAPEFPYLNIARIHISEGAYGAAALQLQIAEMLAPNNLRVADLIDRIITGLNAQGGP